MTLAVKEMDHHVQSTSYINAHHSESVDYQLQLSCHYKKYERNAKEVGEVLGQICFH